MRRTRSRPFDAARYLASERAMAAYLEAALETGEPSVVAAALGDLARAKGMTEAQFRELMAVVALANQTNRLANGYRVAVHERSRAPLAGSR